MKTAVFLDLDGTFWNLGTPPESALEAIRRAQANGHLVLSSTGRTPSGCSDLSGFGFDGHCYGAGSFAELGDKTIVDEPLGADASRRIYHSLDGLRVNIFVEGAKGCGFLEVRDRVVNWAMHKQIDKTNDPFMDLRDISEMTDSDHERVYKYSVFSSGNTLKKVRPTTPEGFVWTGMHASAEITRVDVNKGTCIRKVKDYLVAQGLGDGGGWRTLAMGDSGNDITALKAADIGVAMGNGTKEAKAAADYVTDDIDHDGLYNAFEHFGLI